MRFIIKVCDERGFELGTHEQQAEPHFALVSETVTFELKSFYLAMTRELFEMLAEREKDKYSGQNDTNTRVERKEE